ncbi:MAG: hypothetical protein V1754_04620, partial [Pseudomonadota bacterium]
GIGETLEWIGQEMIGGTLTIKSICTKEGEDISRTISATLVDVTLESPIPNIPKFGILRRRKC